MAEQLILDASPENLARIQRHLAVASGSSPQETINVLRNRPLTDRLTDPQSIVDIVATGEDLGVAQSALRNNAQNLAQSASELGEQGLKNYVSFSGSALGFNPIESAARAIGASVPVARAIDLTVTAAGLATGTETNVSGIAINLMSEEMTRGNAIPAPTTQYNTTDALTLVRSADNDLDSVTLSDLLDATTTTARDIALDPDHNLDVVQAGSDGTLDIALPRQIHIVEADFGSGDDAVVQVPNYDGSLDQANVMTTANDGSPSQTFEISLTEDTRLEIPAEDPPEEKTTIEGTWLLVEYGLTLTFDASGRLISTTTAATAGSASISGDQIIINLTYAPIFCGSVMQTISASLTSPTSASGTIRSTSCGSSGQGDPITLTKR